KAPFDKIKIDQSFVRGAASSSTTNRNAAIIRAIVTLAETLDMDTCAEGVETHDDLQLICELGVSMVQGYIFGQPSPAETAREIARWAQAGQFGVQFDGQLDLASLAPKKEKTAAANLLRPWYVEPQQRSAG